MEPSDAIDARSFWQGQVADWQASGLTQKAYCEEQGLRYTAFGYWVRKLRRAAEPSPGKKPTCFVPVVPDTATGLSLTLPNGRCPPWRAKRRRVVPGSREATRDTRRAEGAKGDPKGASERGVQSYGRPVCSRNELAMLWRNAG